MSTTWSFGDLAEAILATKLARTGLRLGGAGKLTHFHVQAPLSKMHFDLLDNAVESSTTQFRERHANTSISKITTTTTA